MLGKDRKGTSTFPCRLSASFLAILVSDESKNWSVLTGFLLYIMCFAVSSSPLQDRPPTIMSELLLSSKSEPPAGSPKSAAMATSSRDNNMSNGHEQLLSLLTPFMQSLKRDQESYQRLESRLSALLLSPRDPMREIRDLVASSPSITVRNLRARGYTALQVS